MTGKEGTGSQKGGPGIQLPAEPPTLPRPVPGEQEASLAFVYFNKTNPAAFTVTW